MADHLPEKLDMKNTAHGTGDKGLAFYSYEDAEGLGVLLDSRRKDGRSPFIETWRFRWLPDCECPSYQQLRAAVNERSAAAIGAEKAKWPQMPEPPVPSDPRGTGNCWLHPDRPRTHRGWVQTCWHKYDGLTALLCAECAQEADTDPSVIVRASDARRAYCASLPPLSERFGRKP